MTGAARRWRRRRRSGSSSSDAIWPGIGTRVPRGRLRAALRPALARTTWTSTASRPGPTCSEPWASGSRRPLARRIRLPSRLAGPELGAVALAASASLASGLPFLIVRKAGKQYATEQRVEGGLRAGRARLPRRGRRDDRRRRHRGRDGSARGRSRRAERGGVRGRPGGRRKRGASRPPECTSAPCFAPAKSQRRPPWPRPRFEAVSRRCVESPGREAG